VRAYGRRGDGGCQEPDDPDATPHTPRCYVGRAQKSRVFAIASSVAEKGFTGVPTRLYFKGGRVKVELALGLGKELRDKRRAVAARDARREIEREL
jgi:hypothetical protein